MMKSIKSKKLIMLALPILILLALVLLSSLSSAALPQLLCLSKGEQVDFSLCNPVYNTYTCTSDVCQQCVTFSSTGAYCPASPNKCNKVSQGCTSQGNSTIDQDPPVLDILDPIQGEFYTERSLFLSLFTDEISEIHYKDNLDSKERWNFICSRCTSYNRNKNFDEGLNDLTFRAVDLFGNPSFVPISFRIDTRDPRISSTEPKKGYASGMFSIKFTELNPSLLWLHYGNAQTGFASKSINIDTECISDRTTECETSVNLSPYNNQNIQFWFDLTDIAGNSAQSKTQVLTVDTIPPVITSFDYNQDSGRYGNFYITVVEQYFDKVEYIDHSDSKPKWKILCRNLKDGVCEKSRSFSDGFHDIDIRATDEAGNFDQVSTSFYTDTKLPRISKTLPAKGFATGTFEVVFNEANPNDLLLFYGPPGSILISPLNLATDCIKGRRNHECSTSLPLSGFNNQEIQFWFELTDIDGNFIKSKVNILQVDTTPPSIDSILYDIDGSRTEITLEIIENNFDEVEYIDNSATRASWRRFCSRLDEFGICSKKISLRPGLHDIDIQALDEAGNIAAENIQIFVP